MSCLARMSTPKSSGFAAVVSRSRKSFLVASGRPLSTLASAPAKSFKIFVISGFLLVCTSAAMFFASAGEGGGLGGFSVVGAFGAA